MSTGSTSRPVARIVPALLLVMGALMIAYAISDHPFYGGEPGFGRLQALIAATGTGLALCVLLPAGIAGRVLLLAIASATMLAFAEMAGEIVLGPYHRPIYQPDNKLIFSFVPGRTSATIRLPVNGGGAVVHRINSTGFRGNELRPAGEAARVIVYGDSFIHASYSPEEETFVTQLGALLIERTGGPVEAVNGGVSSYGPDQIALKMEGELAGLRPDLVVVAIFAGNDYGDLVRNKIFRLAADGSLMPNPWQLDRRVRAWLDLNLRESILVRALRNTVGSMRAAPDRVAEFGNVDFLLREAEREYRSFVIDGDNNVANTHADYYSADVSVVPSSASARYKVAFMRAVLGRIRDIARHEDVPLAFLFIPHPMDVADQYDGVRVDRKRFPEYDGRNQVGFLEAMALDLGVPHVSLYDIFRATDANLLYFRGGDDHWNAAGQRIAARAMAEYLLARGLLRTGPVAGSRPSRRDGGSRVETGERIPR